ncbi:hypothetical protein ACIQVT_05015 [Streptomyces sp. NPDC100445]|uniref:hypothetical protein n=1 Tax=Streptomyces sp. NPDC100445 TaxID=3366102 RepID=UPI003823EFCF
MRQRRFCGEAFTFAVVHRRAGTDRSRPRGPNATGLESYYLGGLAVVAVFLVVHTALANHRGHRTAADQLTTRVDSAGFDLWLLGLRARAVRMANFTSLRGQGLHEPVRDSVEVEEAHVDGAGGSATRAGNPGSEQAR